MKTSPCCRSSTFRSDDILTLTYNTLRYRVGDTFLHMAHDSALKRLEKDTSDLDAELSGLAENAEECEKSMKELKVTLYAKFGRAINLDE